MAQADLLPLDAIPWRGAWSLLRRALRRHWFVAFAVAALFTGVAVAAAMLLPRSYQGDTRILVRKGTSVMSAVTDPRRAIVPGFDQPAQAAVELALSRSAMEYIVREADLVAHFYANRPPVLQWVDRAREAVSGPMAAADKEEALIGLLQGRLQVYYGEEVVRMRATWGTAEGVELILTHAVAAYLAERRRFDIESLEETQRILASTVQAARVEMTQSVGAFSRARSAATGQRNTVADRRPPTTAEIGRMRDRVTERRKYREELEEQRRERLALLEIQLAQQSETMGPSHPDRISTERAIAGLGTNDDAIRRARLEESRVTDEFLAAGGSLDIFGEGIDESEPIDLAAIRPDDDPTVIAARGELRVRVDGYQDMTMRLENARLELETARAALPFRYVVTQPPMRPRRPVAPNVLIIILGGVVTGVGAGVLLALSLRIRAEARAAGRGIVAHLAQLDQPMVLA